MTSLRTERGRCGSGTLDPAMEPGRYTRRILLCVVGLTPQVVTETVYALAIASATPFAPTEVRLVTTGQGAELIQTGLMDAETGAFRRLCDEYEREDLRPVLAGARLHCIRDADGTLLRDIVSARDSEAAADLIFAQVRVLASDDKAAIHASIAGGRKTMGLYLGFAMALFGRPQDRLSHILIDGALVGHPQFYYPPRRPMRLISSAGSTTLTDDIALTLADLPFFRLALGAPSRLLHGATSYAQAVGRVDDWLRRPELRLERGARRAICHGVSVALPPLLFSWYCWLSTMRVANPRAGAASWMHASTEDFLAEHARNVGAHNGRLERTRRALRAGFTREFFEQKTSGVNRALRAALGALAEPYLIRVLGARPHTRHGLTMPAGQIRIAP